MHHSIRHNRIFSSIIGAVLLLITASTHATLMTFTDKVDTGPDYRLIAFGSNLSYSFTHNIITGQDEGTQSYFRSGSYGFNPLTDLISSISLSLRFKDESDDIAPESVQFIFNGQSLGTQTITSGGTIYTAAFLSELDTFLNDGILNVTLQNAGITNGPQEGRSDSFYRFNFDR